MTLRLRGFSLIELLMVSAILGVLSLLAVPALAGMLQRAQLPSAQREFIAALQLARSQAILGATSTTLCPSRDGAQCSGDARWESGWLLLRDGRATPLRVGGPYAGLIILGDSGRRHIRFHADGTASGSTNTLRLCRHGHAEAALLVVIANSGRVRGDQADAAQAARCAEAP